MTRYETVSEPMKLWHYILIGLALLIPLLASCQSAQYFQDRAESLRAELALEEAQIYQAYTEGDLTRTERDEALNQVRKEYNEALADAADVAGEMAEDEIGRLKQGGEEFGLTLMEILLAGAGLGAVGAGARAAYKKSKESK